MKLFTFFLPLVIAAACFSQTAATTFPGLTPVQKQKLLNSKVKVPLPTWVPAGFKVTNVVAKTGKPLPLENWQLTVTYSKKLANLSYQRFYIDAGFEGIGDIGVDYDGEGEEIKTKVGTITLYYQPVADVDGKKEKQVNFITTEWFTVNKIAFSLGTPELTEEAIAKNTEKLEVISHDEIRKIIKSLQVLK